MCRTECYCAKLKRGAAAVSKYYDRQMADSGISPGSGVRNRRKELSRRTLGVPVIAVGIPTVADCAREDGPPMMVTPREIDTIILNAAKVIAFAIDRALQPSLSFEDLTALSS